MTRSADKYVMGAVAGAEEKRKEQRGLAIVDPGNTYRNKT
ncbi:hypothetical protein GGR27_001273 [Lewinella antarctica]|uniref:Uncharacterized protein n=1 Tax=Neolewinella antarctica TaxID=442734 RepID=A0ABX0X9Z6_9BACT|nr:hypothetical protein [Neolewinella antarctica]